jgi:Regulator of ribonuclease activity B
MPHDMDQQLALTAAVVEQNLAVGDRVDQPRWIDHLAGFRSRRAAVAAAADLAAAGYRIDGMRRRLLTVWVEFGAETAVDHARAAEFTREVVGIVDRHGGAYDGWGGFIVGDPDATSSIS